MSAVEAGSSLYGETWTFGSCRQFLDLSNEPETIASNGKLYVDVDSPDQARWDHYIDEPLAGDALYTAQRGHN